MAQIQPRTLKGFRDFLPDAMLAREWLVETTRRVYRSYGFAPIDTPALELLEVLMGKGGAESDRQLYQFTDAGGRRVGMRFDLTVPLARFAAQHAAQLPMPFKRYHIGTVWRGENPQAGRYREFMQCDFDTIGTTSTTSDIETVLVIHDLMRAIGFERFQIRVNNRRVLTGWLEGIGLVEQATDVLRSIDKLDKIGAAGVAEELRRLEQVNDRQVAEVMEYVSLRGSRAEVLDLLQPRVAGSTSGQRGLDELRQLDSALAALGIGDDRVALDVAIARGLDYYTGTVMETVLGDLQAIGSVCSGGRYDDLTSLFSDQPLPGIGASLGLDRLLAAMEELQMLPGGTTPAQVFIALFDERWLHAYLQLAAALRAAGWGVELYGEPKKLGQQLKYADRRGFAVAIVAGDDEFQRGTVQLKWLARKAQEEITLGRVAGKLDATAILQALDAGLKKP
jgi:histidyl-tRNA synthetase